MDIQLIETELNQRLTQPLPGAMAHEKMVPPSRKASLHFPLPKDHVKYSAVLLLLYAKEGTLKFVLIKRARYDGVHSGQIALPGGQFETGDKDLKFTALRESQEEVGIDVGKVRVIGKLSEIYIPPSNFRVQPFVGFYSEEPVFKADGIETTRTIEVSLEDFLNPDWQTEKTVVRRNGEEIKVPCFYLNSEVVWGATAMILSEFLTVLNEIPKQHLISFR